MEYGGWWEFNRERERERGIEKDPSDMGSQKIHNLLLSKMGKIFDILSGYEMERAST
jgi:hypothetical protein